MKCKRCRQEFDDIPRETGLCINCYMDLGLAGLKNGDLVKITHCYHGHRFPIGSTCKILSLYEPRCTPSIKATSADGTIYDHRSYWYLDTEEFQKAGD